MNAQPQIEQSPLPEIETPHLEILPGPAPAADPRSRIQNPASSNGHAVASIQNPVSSIEHPASSIQTAPKRIRNGKIARLTFIERDMVNRMLRDNIPYEKIVGALDEHGTRVTERNVSNW